ncbi:50S ribosomal protein L30 [Schaalia turicensis]|uniref:50S ribosomal protein L30 n=1 Tax=Schaalia turicensis TaxID=131111 RepID=UPI003FA46EB6
MMANIKITQTKSSIGAKQNMKDTLRTLGLRKIGQSVVRKNTETVLGAVHTVRHLVTVEEVD